MAESGRITMMYMYGNGSPLTGWAYTLMVIGMVVFWCLVIGGGIVLVRFLIRGVPTPPVPPTHGAEQLLGERFARGEIDEQEYQHRHDLLRAMTERRQ
jgi:putative membrane protein